MSLVAGFMFFIIIMPKAQYSCTVTENQGVPLPVPHVSLSVQNIWETLFGGMQKRQRKCLKSTS